MNSKLYKKIIYDKVNEVLKIRLFKRKRNTFIFSNEDLTYYINIQSSQNSTADILKITINIEIASAILSKLDDTSLPIEYHRHYTRRIGDYLKNEQDKWWTVDTIESAEIIANEIVMILSNNVLPSFELIQNTDDLIKVWKQGEHIGITNEQRVKYLNLFAKHLK